MRLLPPLSAPTTDQGLFQRAFSNLWTFSSPDSASSSVSLCEKKGRLDKLGYVVIEVESVMHRLPGDRLARFSGAFGRTLLEAKQRNPGAEPRIALDECTNYDFESVAEIIYPSSIPYPVLNKKQLMAALSLSVQWEMKEVKSFVVGLLLKLGLSTVEKIDLGRRFMVVTFLMEGCVELVRKAPDIPVEDIKKVGWDTYGLICFARWKVDGNVSGSTCQIPVTDLGCTNQGCRGCKLRVSCNAPPSYSWTGSQHREPSRKIESVKVNISGVKRPLPEGEQMDAYIWALLEEHGIRK